VEECECRRRRESDRGERVALGVLGGVVLVSAFVCKGINFL
jgi:hypothetical protein